MKNLTSIMVVCLACLAVSCGPKALTFHDVQYLRKGMPLDSVTAMLPIEHDGAYTVSAKAEYLVHAYPLLTEKIKTSNSYGGGTTGGYSVTTSTDLVNAFYLIYRGGRLRYWGMMSDIQRSEDLEVQEAAPALYQQLSATR